jgi:transcription initiation factor IIE alpha subunit
VRPSVFSQKEIVRNSRPRANVFIENIKHSPLKPTSISNGCKCHNEHPQEEFEEIERRQCPMCNSLLIKKTLSPIRKSVETRLRNLRTFGENTDSVAVDTILRASSRNQLKEYNMKLSPLK